MSSASVSGSTNKKNVIRLGRVSYHVSLVYLGHDRIKHDNDKYRCKYELQRNETLIAGGPAPIANVVGPNDRVERSVNAALPYPDGGDNQLPANEELFRLMITDNHAMRSCDDLLGTPGDSTSKVDNYKAKISASGTVTSKKDWRPDIEPAVPFRIVIKKFIGSERVPLKEDLSVIVHVKDPAEEIGVITGSADDHNRRKFNRKFFGKYNRTNERRTKGDDNAVVRFGGRRTPDASYPGVKATEVIKKVKYVNTPVADVGACPADCVKFSDLSSATAHGSSRVKLVPEKVDVPEGKVGVADFAFCPPSVGGDNYRFLITLMKGGKDIREVKENGLACRMKDSGGALIPEKQAYCTGRIVLWKRVHFKLMACCNGLTNADITWATVQSVYRKAFMEVVEPEIVYTVRRSTWKAALKAHFPAQSAALDAAAETGAPVYATDFVPPSLQATFDLDNDLQPLALELVDKACDRRGVTSPRVNTAQDNSEGLFIFYCRMGSYNSSAVGAYFSDRTFWFFEQGDQPSTTSTCAHELGHAMYLRHSHTLRMGLNLTVGGVMTRITVPDGDFNNNLLDHDQNDAFACLMSYTRATTAAPCGLCCLTLRMFDRVKIADPARFQKQAMKAAGPAAFYQYTPGTAPPSAGQPMATPNVATDVISDLASGSWKALMVLGPEVDFTDRSGSARKGRLNLTKPQASNPLANFTFSGTSTYTKRIVSTDADILFSCLIVENATPGTVKIKYKKSGITCEVNFNVT
jgi:hypothetical protein